MTNKAWNKEFVWEDPPNRTKGKDLMPYTEIIAELEKNPNKWAKFDGIADRLQANTISRTFRGHGCEASTRKQSENNYAVYVMWPLREEADAHSPES